MSQKIYLHLDGETILNFDYSQHGDYQTEIDKATLVNSSGQIIYKYSGGQLVALSAEEINQHPSARLKKLNIIRNNRVDLLKEADYKINELEDQSQDASAWRTYRQSLRDCTNNYKDGNGKPTSAIDAIVAGEFSYPSKP